MLPGLSAHKGLRACRVRKENPGAQVFLDFKALVDR